MTYKINGTTIAQPETGAWRPRDTIGIDGNGKPVYPSQREFELRWGLMDLDDFCQLESMYFAQGVTGTVVADLPYFCSGSWTFRSYTGTNMYEPRSGVFFEEHQTNVFLLITNIRTE